MCSHVMTLSILKAYDIMKDYKKGVEESGPKIVLLMSLVAETLKVGDKMLIFSQSLYTLNLIEYFLGQREIPVSGREGEKWAKNKSYFRKSTTPDLLPLCNSLLSTTNLTTDLLQAWMAVPQLVNEKNSSTSSMILIAKFFFFCCLQGRYIFCSLLHKLYPYLM